MSESYTLAREGDPSWEHGEEKMDSTVKEGTFQGDEGGQAKKSLPRRSRRKHE